MLRKRLMTLALAVVMTVSVFTGCGSKDDSKTSRSESKKTEQQKSDAKKEKAAEKEETKAPIEDGTYTAEFKTDSSMFHVNDAYDDKGTLTVKDGKMTIHISLVSKNIVNLFPGTIKDAGYKNVILRPLMVVAGDHANNDMAGDDDDSWLSQFEASKNFDSVKTQIAGLGEIDAIQQLYAAHTKAAMDAQ